MRLDAREVVDELTRLFLPEPMSHIHQLIEVLRKRSEMSIVEQKQAWLVVIPKGPDFVCEVTVPHNVLEWFASVKQTSDAREVWSDWMDYTGYDDSPMEKLEAEMADDLIAFIDRVSASALVLPLRIWEERV